MSLTRSYQHSSFDLLLAGVETVVTFALAYPAAVALGAVLLQTAPLRGLAGQRMEAFLRVMREVRPASLSMPSGPYSHFVFSSNGTRKCYTSPRRTFGNSPRTPHAPSTCAPWRHGMDLRSPS